MKWSLTPFITLFLACAALAALPASLDAKTFRWASQGEYLTADPHATNEGHTNSINGQVYDGLVMRGRRHEIIPALATSWRQETPTRWVFRLRRGVKFHEGEDFTADDVVFSFERMRQTPGFRFHAASIGEASAIDAHTVAFVTPRPNPLMIETLAENLFVMSRAWCRRHRVEAPQNFAAREETYAATHANGTGAFLLVSREAESRTVFRRNPAWWGIDAGLFDGNVDEFAYVPIKSDGTRVAALLSGEIDFVLDVPPQDVERLRRDPGIRLYEGVENRVVYLSMDQARAELLYSDVKGRNPFQDARVRRAISHAIDVDTIRNNVMRGLSRPTGALLPNPSLVGVPAALESHDAYDTAQARRLLAEAGYPSGFKVTLDCPNNRLVNDERICIAVAAMLAKVGIRVDVSAMPRATFFPKVRNRDTSFFLFSWGGAAEPMFTLPPLMHSANAEGDGGFNLGGYRDERLDALIDAAKEEMDAARRQEIVLEALQRHRDNAYDIPLHLQVTVWAARRNVTALHRPDNWLQVSWVKVE